MTRIILFLITSLLWQSPVEETRKKITLSTNPNVKELFYVLKSDPEVRHGPYKLSYKEKTLVEGHFRYGVKDSLWNHYNESGKLKMCGYYQDTRRVGIWKFFDNDNKLEQEIDFTKQTVLFYKTKFSKHPFKLIDGSDTLVSVLDRPPLYVGGTSRVDEYIAKGTVLPLHKPSDKVKGVVYVEFIINNDGQTSNYRVLKGISTSCNNEALRVVQSIPNEWIPGSLNDRNVSVFYTIPVTFNEKTKEIALRDIFEISDILKQNLKP